MYLDRYGDCFHGTYFPVHAQDEYSILSHGGEAFDTLRCEITFKSERNDRLCLHFQRFLISRCDVKFEVYPEQSASGKALVSNSPFNQLMRSALFLPYKRFDLSIVIQGLPTFFSPFLYTSHCVHPNKLPFIGHLAYILMKMKQKSPSLKLHTWERKRKK